MIEAIGIGPIVLVVVAIAVGWCVVETRRGAQLRRLKRQSYEHLMETVPSAAFQAWAAQHGLGLLEGYHRYTGPARTVLYVHPDRFTGIGPRERQQLAAFFGWPEDQLGIRQQGKCLDLRRNDWLPEKLRFDIQAQGRRQPPAGA